MPPDRGNWKLTPLPPLNVTTYLLLTETNVFSLSPWVAEISSGGGECGLSLEQPNITMQSFTKNLLRGCIWVKCSLMDVKCTLTSQPGLRALQTSSH
jgi:hypothetical protein